VEGHEPPAGQDAPRTGFRPITPGYVEAMGMRLLGGRSVTPDDRANTAPVGVINEHLAREAFGQSDPLGRILLLGSGEEQSRLRVVGVVADVRQSDLRTPSHPEIYLPQSQTGLSRMYVVARTDSDPGLALQALQQAVQTVDQDAFVSRSMVVRDVVERSHADTRFVAEMLGLFGLVALLLGGVGVYGVTAHAVSQRKRDIGIRMALGADRGRVALRTFLEGMAPVTVGIATGLLLALWGARMMAGLLYGVTATDPVTLVVAPALLAAIGATSLALPALRASRIDPVRSLREE
jgi:predicted permease